MSVRSYSSEDIAFVKDIIYKLITDKFASTLGRESDIVNIFNALIYYESRYRFEDAISPPNPTRRGTAGFTFLNSSAIQTVLQLGSPTEIANIRKSVSAIGLCQVLAFYFIRGSSPSGICEIQRLRPDLSSGLTVAPGQDPFPLILGRSNSEKAIMSGLIILEGKYRAVRSSGDGFTVAGDRFKRIFPSKIAGAVGAYLGLGASDINNATPERYSESIVGGSAYLIANGKNSVKIANNNVQSSNGPKTNGSDKTKISAAGC
jgi:hypothetical protein